MERYIPVDDKKWYHKTIHYYFIHPNLMEWIWPNVIYAILIHVLFIYACYMVVMDSNLNSLWMYSVVLQTYVSLGVSAGVHRMWCHQAYKAKIGVRIFLMIGWTLLGGSTLNNWSTHHRVHHKYSDTDGDPSNTKRGIFHCHIGWTLRYPHPEYLDKKADLVPYLNFMKDPVVEFHQNHYGKLVLITNAIVILFPVLFMQSSLWESFLITFILRSVIAYHWFFLATSAAHLYGSKPYCLDMKPGQNPFLSLGSAGEGYHNYHHAFPYDYAIAEDGEWCNLGKMFIEGCSYFGWTYNLKRVTKEQLEKSKQEVLERKLFDMKQKEEADAHFRCT